jgi:predicted nucleotidyltransferase
MRISKEEKDILVGEVTRIFGKKAKLYLFGSRTLDQKKGGDIDLLIRTGGNEINREVLFSKKMDLLVALELLLGEQKIDIVLELPGDTRKIIKTALNTGIELC